MHLVLVLLLSIQLTGLTCIDDFGSDPAISLSLNAVSHLADSSEPLSPPAQELLEHDCPCHYMVTYLAPFALESLARTEELLVAKGSPLRENLSRSIFHPPVVLS